MQIPGNVVKQEKLDDDIEETEPNDEGIEEMEQVCDYSTDNYILSLYSNLHLLCWYLIKYKYILATKILSLIVLVYWIEL